jgi:acylphosphatase
MHLSYVGDVDDPTFRYSAKVSARHAGVTGWISKAVHGFSDVCVQGTAEQIKYYKHSILRRARRHGLHCNVAGSEELSPVENETGFTFRLDMEF